MYPSVRYEGKWYKIQPKRYEPESQTFKIAWMMIRNPALTSEQAYRLYFQEQREDVKVLYPSFRKEENGS